MTFRTSAVASSFSREETRNRKCRSGTWDLSKQLFTRHNNFPGVFCERRSSECGHPEGTPGSRERNRGPTRERVRPGWNNLPLYLICTGKVSEYSFHMSCKSFMEKQLHISFRLHCKTHHGGTKATGTNTPVPAAPAP